QRPWRQRRLAAALARRRAQRQRAGRAGCGGAGAQRSQAAAAARTACRKRAGRHRDPSAIAGRPLSLLHGTRRRHAGDGGPRMNQVWNIARKELSDGLRNRWLLAISLLFAVLAVGIAWLGAAASGQLG